jgi:hypothetical protein
VRSLAIPSIHNAASISHHASYPASIQVIEELEADIVELEKQACAACTKCKATPSYAISPSHSLVSDSGDTLLLDALEVDILDLRLKLRCSHRPAILTIRKRLIFQVIIQTDLPLQTSEKVLLDGSESNVRKLSTWVTKVRAQAT